jgi:flagellar biosynthesis protein FlhF
LNSQFPGAPPLGTDQHAAITRKLSSIEQMVTQLTRDSLQQQADVPTELFQLYTELIDVDVDEELARGLIQRIKDEAASGTADPAGGAKRRLAALIEPDIRCAPPIMVTPGRRRVVALVGPTGVGKTTTIAKLAANFRLRDGIRLGLVTVDTYRVAAVEQLRTYAEIIDLPMKVVTSPREMRRALDELAGLDLVLIDTAGRSPRDELKIQELKSLLAEAQVDEVHLVLSLAASARSLQSTAEKFAPAGTTSLILTKLDEAIGMGALLSASRRIPLPVSYLTTGQDVPDDIENANSKRISRLALGEESLFGRPQRTESGPGAPNRK